MTSTTTAFPTLFDNVTPSLTLASKSASKSASASASSSASCSSSCGMGERPLTTIQDIRMPTPTKIETFSWSDFPIIVHEGSSDDSDSDSDSSCSSDSDSDSDDWSFSVCMFHTNTDTATPTPTAAPNSSSTSSSSTSRRRNRSTFYDGDSNSMNDYIQSSRSSNNYIENDDQDDNIEEEATKRAKPAQYSPTSSVEFELQHQNQRERVVRVRFAEYIEVRTYNVILGDHPWCEDGYAIELGNDVLSIDYQHKYYQHSLLHRRSYLERKSLLIAVGGYTEKELKDQLNNNSDIINISCGLSRVRSVDSCLSHVLNTIANAAA